MNQLWKPKYRVEKAQLLYQGIPKKDFRYIERYWRDKPGWFSQTLKIHWPEGKDDVATEEEVMAHFTTDDYAPDAVRVAYKSPWNPNKKAYVHFPDHYVIHKARKEQGEGEIAGVKYVARIANEKTWICVRDGMRPSQRIAWPERNVAYKAYGAEKYDQFDDSFKDGKKSGMKQRFDNKKMWLPLGTRSNPFYPGEKPTMNQPSFVDSSVPDMEKAWYEGTYLEDDGSGTYPTWPTLQDPKGKEVDNDAIASDTTFRVRKGTSDRPYRDIKYVLNENGLRATTKTEKKALGTEKNPWKPKDHWTSQLS